LGGIVRRGIQNKAFRDRQHRMFVSACLKPEPKGKDMIKTTMYFGRTISGPGGASEVTYFDLLDFREKVIDKYFDGYTYFEAYGMWKGVKEKSFVVEIIHEKAYENASKVSAIAEEYKSLFNQEAVAITVQELNFQLI
jgi:hypothetical protein